MIIDGVFPSILTGLIMIYGAASKVMAAAVAC
jgi:hypothetical protein